MQATKFYAIASAMAQRGVPVMPCRGKAAFLPDWQISNFTTDLQQISRWAQEYPDCNAGCVATNDGFWYLDDDCGTLVADIERDTGEKFPETFTVLTGSLKHHYYFKQNDASRKMGNARVKGRFDAQQSQTQVIAPGSVHPDPPYRTYQVEKDLPIVEAPGWLCSWVESTHAALHPLKLVKPVKLGDGTGDVNENLRWLKKFLRRSGVVVRSNPVPYSTGFKICVDCPNEMQHSKCSGTTQTCVMAYPDGYGFECRHTHCEDKDWSWFRSQVEREIDLNDPRMPVDFSDPEEVAAQETREVTTQDTLTAATWDAIAKVLCEMRDGKEKYLDAKGNEREKARPKHRVEEDIVKFSFSVFHAKAKLFFDAYPYLFLPEETSIVKFHDDREAFSLLARLHLRVGQWDAKLVRENLALHIATFGESTQIERWGCFRNDHVYVNNGRRGMFRIGLDVIDEVPNGTDGVYMLAEEVLPWPELTADVRQKMAVISGKLGAYGLKVTEDSKLCLHLDALFERGELSPEQYQQLFLTRYLSLFLAGYTKLRPLMLALGEQNSGKSTLYEKIMWLLCGTGYESDAMPRDLRGFLAAVTNNHVKIFDNVDGTDVDEAGLADYICKCASGGVVPIAQLYKTNVEKLFKLRCDLFFTSRYNPWPSHRSDLSRRTLFLPIRKPKQEEYITVEKMQHDLWEDREEMLLETLIRLQNVLRGLLANRDVNYPPASEMHSYEIYTMRAADHEGWKAGMRTIWQRYYKEYEERVTEFSPIVDEVKKWLGYSNIGKHPNVGRWVRVNELYRDIKRLAGRDCTWKNESAFGRALERHLSAMRALGMEMKRPQNRKMLKFDPTPEVMESCISMYQDSGAQTYLTQEEQTANEVMEMLGSDL